MEYIDTIGISSIHFENKKTYILHIITHQQVTKNSTKTWLSRHQDNTMKRRLEVGAIERNCTSGARPTKHISIEFEIRWKFKTL